ncbi:MAG TPA: FHA domain-containing protein, partial [Bdellovibrio sp.]|nr:FHA domain-containing protein [Bdellovibrio sp.]
MPIFIEIIEGNNQGSRYPIREGLTLGRSKADIVIKDQKVSSTHAQISVDGKGQLILVDLDSSNGLYISGRRVKKISLLQGVVFEVGRTMFKVVEVEEEKALDLELFMTWRKALATKLKNAPIDETLQPRHCERFSPALKLQFMQGIQANEEFVLGYGPRAAGADSLDIELLDEDAPREAFELHSGPGMVQLKIVAAGRVHLNGHSVDEKMLEDGDLISFG